MPDHKPDRPAKKFPGRPAELRMPMPIPDTPMNVLSAVLATPTTPPGGWKYLKRRHAKKVLG